MLGLGISGSVVLDLSSKIFSLKNVRSTGCLIVRVIRNPFADRMAIWFLVVDGRSRQAEDLI